MKLDTLTVIELMYRLAAYSKHTKPEYKQGIITAIDVIAVLGGVNTNNVLGKGWDKE